MDQSLSNSHVESPANIMSIMDMNNNNNFQEISTNGEKQRLQGNDFSSWRDNQLLLLHGNQELSLSLNGGYMQMDPYSGCCSNLQISGHGHGNDDPLSNIMQIDHGYNNPKSPFPNSKYLKVAQQLLDEVVNVRKALKRPDSNMGLDDLQQKNAYASPQDCSGSKRTELSVVEKHNLQQKLTKLVAMLDQVDRRYKQYYNQIQNVVLTFESIAGTGAARPYTALAVQTISRHFKSLRDLITGQIILTRNSLGEEQDTNGNVRGIGISRLRHVDQQLRQQKTIQQQHAWRPQRGLPENSVSILRAWLFEHFLHPYPKDCDKMVLARETGLTRNQVSNWFINARVRLWKPMVEEMYKEEFGLADQMVPGNVTISEMGHDGSVFSDAMSLTLGLQNLGDNYRLPISTAGHLNQFNF